MVAAVIANVNRGKGSRAFGEADFMPPDVTPRPSQPKQTASEQKAILDAVFAPFRRRKAAKAKEGKEG